MDIADAPSSIRTRLGYLQEYSILPAVVSSHHTIVQKMLLPQAIELKEEHIIFDIPVQQGHRLEEIRATIRRLGGTNSKIERIRMDMALRLDEVVKS